MDILANNQNDVIENSENDDISNINTVGSKDLMDQDFSLFDPFSDTKHVGNNLDVKSEEVKNIPKKSLNDDNVIIEDLLGGFSEVVRSDSIEKKEEERQTSTTSFFLLDFDNNGADSITPRNSENDNPVSLDTTDNSEVLSIVEGNLPFDETNDEKELASGFFFNDLLEDNKSAPILVTTPAKPKNNLEAPQKCEDHDPIIDSSQGFPNFQIGHAVGTKHDSLIQEDFNVETKPEDGLNSILDIDIPDIPIEDINKKNSLASDPLVSFVTEIEDFNSEEKIVGVDHTNSEMNDSEITANADQVMELQGLEAELKPVFDMCKPNPDGLISIEHLMKMCRDQGQVSLKIFILLIY